MRRGSSRSMQSPEARDLARALRISVRYARHASRGIPGNEQAARACFVTWKSPTGTGDCVDAPALSSQALAASFLAPARVFVAPYSSTTLGKGGDIYSLRCPRDMPRSLHYDRSAPHVCHWHTGCTKRFSSKRQLFLHLGEEHGLQPDAERGGFRATGLGARARRRESRAALSRRPRPRSPVDQRFNALQTSPLGETWFDSVPPNSSLPPPAWAALPPPPTSATMPRPAPPTSSLLPTTMMTQQPPPTTTSMSRPPGHYIRGVRFDRCLPPSAPFLTDSVLPDGYALSAGLSSTGSAQLPGGSGRNAATGSTPSGASADMKPPLVSAPAERPPSGSNGSRTISAERPPVSAETPTASPAGRPPLTTCVSRLKGRHFGVSPGPVPIRPPARPRGDVDDDLWVRRPRPWNSWTRDSSLDAANVGF